MPSASNRLRASSRAHVCILGEAANVSQASDSTMSLVEADAQIVSLINDFDRLGVSAQTSEYQPRVD